MPLLIYRYILADLLKVFTLTTLVLVTVIAFGATIDPLTSGGILSAGEAMRYMVLAMIPMLQFALPFAAGFASTIVLHRMTNDNEIVAAAASGISYRRLLAPIAALGLLLTLAMVGLTQTVIPRFWANMERVIAADVARLIQHSVESGVPASFGNLQIYADDLRIIANPRDTDADVRLVLFRVAVAELDSLGRVDTDGSAAQAIVDLHRRDGETYVKIAMGQGQYESSGGQRGGWDEGAQPRAVVIPSMLRDHLRTRTRAELLEFRSNPDGYRRVRDERDALTRALLDRDIAATIDREIRERGEIELIQQSPTRRRYVIRADAYQEGAFVMEGGGPVLVRQFEGTAAVRRMVADQVRLSRSGRDGEIAPLFDIEMTNVEVTDLQAGGLVNRRARLPDERLALAGLSSPANEPNAETSAQVIARAKATDDVEPQVRRLERRIDSLHREITSRILARYAQSATAILLLVFGATLAMLLRGTLPLVIYLWAFLPSILNLIMISGGDKMMRDGDIVSGLAVMWGGSALLFVLFVLAYWRLSRN